MTEAVKVTNLVQEFKMGEVVVPALRGVNFSIPKGHFVSIIGPSGSGKSTLLNLIGGLDRFISGKIVVDNVDISTLSEKQLAEYRKKKVGFVFQSYNLIPTLTALQNVELPLIFAGVSKEKRDKRAKEVLEAVRLSERTEHKPTELSGGEQQRVSLARALVNEPAIILADEPTGNLDTSTSHEILKLLKELNERNHQTFIIVTHDPEVSQYADKAIHIRDGLIEKEEGGNKG